MEQKNQAGDDQVEQKNHAGCDRGEQWMLSGRAISTQIFFLNLGVCVFQIIRY